MSVVGVSEYEYVHLLSTLAERSLTLAALFLALGICIGKPVLGLATARRFPLTTALGSSSISHRLRHERRNGASEAIVVKVTMRSRGRKHTLSGSCLLCKPTARKHSSQAI